MLATFISTFREGTFQISYSLDSRVYVKESGPAQLGSSHMCEDQIFSVELRN